MTFPLAGIKVLDFSEHGFVPSAAAALADFGADVIKIERPTGDPMRLVHPNQLVPSADGVEYMYDLVNRNKRSIALDVTVPAGREVLERLVQWADVYITNQLPRVRRKLRTEPADLFAVNPRLVFAKGHGYGQAGPDAESGGFDGVSYWARGAVAHTLTPDGAQEPIDQRPALGDIPSGMFLAGGICAALVHTLRTGQGVVVDTSLLGAAAWALGPDLAYASVTGRMMDSGKDRPRSPLTFAYRTRDGRYLQLIMLDDDRYWAQACRAVGLPELIDDYPDDAARRPAWPALRERFRAAVAGFARAELSDRLRAEGCIFSVFADPPEAVADPAVAANGYLMPHPTVPGLRLAAAPVQFDDAQPAIRRPAPGIGEHSGEVLAELGYGHDEVARLATDGVVRLAD
ncbi:MULTISPECIES: CaiB/BaiF CoA-transferase family protein [unclassified Pseudofrankia]|uniref:CaiB/BaiF CoA transferase family protein n=1 Tax=unclassified Pseudofrankia TaxID=2994372 RepID=UPI0008DA7B36|nr:MULTISPECIES: CoA transferase [unclassified Pseudofrankia]MDT3438783.1 CoA transferase [Pseudofrankia sp. BMG5.37]OHV75172.1 CoA-transferase [Pseudofrankia sp. BMG5.36]